MRKVGVYAVLALLFLAFSSLPSSAATSAVTGKIIALDPGHGGNESGAVFKFSDGSVLREKDINLAVAKVLEDLLEADGARVILTRVDDRYVSLDERADIANSNRAQALVSIHHNGSSNSSYDWTETYYSQRSDKRLAEAAYDALLALGLPGRGAKHAGFTLTVRPKMPSTLTEAYFVTNPTEASRFYRTLAASSTDFGRVQRVKEEAAALRVGLIRYFEGLTSGPPNKR